MLTICKGRNKNSRLVGTLDVVASIDPDMPLGADPRMQTIFRILPPFAEIYSGDNLTDGTTVWVAEKRENNAASVTVDFNLEQQ